MSKKEIDIPSVVIDKASYLTYIKLKDSTVLAAESRVISTSDLNLTIDPLILLPVIKSRIQDLPFAEQEGILKRVNVIKVLHIKMMEARGKAYGKPAPASINAMSTESARMFIDERSSEVLGYLGRYVSEDDIRKTIHLEWGMDIPTSSIKKFKADNQDKITALQETFKKSTDSIRLSHKKGRLEELTLLYEDRKRKYDQSGARAEAELMLKIIKQLKDEMHINSLNISGEITHKMELTVSEHVEREIMGSLAINDIIIARAAFRMGVNPALLINRLHNSIYSKFSGFNTKNQDFMSEEVKYPSSMVYDWKAIEKQNKDVSAKKKEYTKFDVVSPKDKVKALSLREKLKKRLDDKVVSVRGIQSNIENNTK